MKNATQEDVTRAQQLGELEPGIMYNYYGNSKYHCKEVAPYLVNMLRKSGGYCENFIVCERSDGQLSVINPAFLIAHKAKGPSHTPKKPMRKPIKGTKPWTKIPYKFEDVEVGDVVELIGFVSQEKKSSKICKKDEYSWIDSEGLWGDYGWCPEEWQEAHILKPYKEPVEEKLLASEEEEVYRIGDWLEVKWHIYSGSFIVQLVQVSAGVVKLITEEGNRLNDVEMTHFCCVIDKAEITKALDNRTFTKLKEKQ